MEIKNIFIKDLANAKINKDKMLKFVLEELLIRIGNTSDDKKIINIVEHIIDEKGAKVVRLLRKSKIREIEIDVYSINVYNSYLCRYVFKKNRQILYQHRFAVNTPYWNKEFDIEPKIIKGSKKRFFNLF